MPLDLQNPGCQPPRALITDCRVARTSSSARSAGPAAREESIASSAFVSSGVRPADSDERMKRVPRLDEKNAASRACAARSAVPTHSPNSNDADEEGEALNMLRTS